MVGLKLGSVKIGKNKMLNQSTSVSIIKEENKGLDKICITAYHEHMSCMKPFCRDDNKRWIFIKYCVDYYYTYFVPVLLKI